jgi:hypothetical protein
MIKVKILSKLITGMDELDEGRVDDTIKKYPGQEELIRKIADANIANNKYLPWLVAHVVAENYPVDSAIELIKKFDQAIKHMEPEFRDINRYKTLEELEIEMEDQGESVSELERSGAKILLSAFEERPDPKNPKKKELVRVGRFDLIRPLNVYSSCKVGVHSRWCIAATKSKNYYKYYTKAGFIFYTIIDYEKPKEDENSFFTYVFHQPSREFRDIYNTVDSKVDRTNVKNAIGQQNEEKLFDLMRDEIGELKQTMSVSDEGHYGFYSRLSKLLKAYEERFAEFEKATKTLKQYEKENPDSYGGEYPYLEKAASDANYKADTAKEAVTEEIEDFLRDWSGRVDDVSHIKAGKESKLSKRAKNNILKLFEKFVKISHRLGQSLRNYLAEIPTVSGSIAPVYEAMRDDPVFFKKMNALSKELLREPDYFEKREGMIKELLTRDPKGWSNDADIGDFVRQAVLQEDFESIKNLFIGFSKLPSYDSKFHEDSRAHYILNHLYDTNSKEAVDIGFDFFKFLFDKADDSNKKYFCIEALFVRTNRSTIRNYSSDIIKYGLNKMASEEYRKRYSITDKDFKLFLNYCSSLFEYLGKDKSVIGMLFDMSNDYFVHSLLLDKPSVISSLDKESCMKLVDTILDPKAFGAILKIKADSEWFFPDEFLEDTFTGLFENPNLDEEVYFELYNFLLKEYPKLFKSRNERKSGRWRDILDSLERRAIRLNDPEYTLGDAAPRTRRQATENKLFFYNKDNKIFKLI